MQEFRATLIFQTLNQNKLLDFFPGALSVSVLLNIQYNNLRIQFQHVGTHYHLHCFA